MTMTRDSILKTANDRRQIIRQQVSSRIPKRMRSKVDASDIIQETLVDIWSRGEVANAIQAPSQFNWLLSVVKHNLVDAYRRFVGSQKRSVLREEDWNQSTTPNAVAQTCGSASDGLRQQERQSILREVLELLPIEYRTVLELHFLRGMTYAEISSKIERSEDAVRMLSNRALRAALGLMKERGFSSPSL